MGSASSSNLHLEAPNVSGAAGDHSAEVHEESDYQNAEYLDDTEDIADYSMEDNPGEYYEDISFKRRSEVWTHFWYSKLQKSAKCKYCQGIVNLGQSESTGHLRQHLNSQK